MLTPIRYEDGIPVFLTSDIDDYGMPWIFGFTEWTAINDNDKPMVMDWQMEIDRKMRPIHRYSRVARFTSVLAQLTQCRGNVPQDLIDEVEEQVPNLNWNSVHKFLKKKQYKNYYNRIPMILHELGIELIEFKITNTQIHDLITRFKQVATKFDALRNERKYFPSIRFIALKLLEEIGADIGNIPLMRTEKKKAALESLWLLIC